MVNVSFDYYFEKKFKKLDTEIKNKLKKRISKIVESPEIGKPMNCARKGTRETYVPPFRLSYAFLEKENLIVFLDLYHKDAQ